MIAVEIRVETIEFNSNGNRQIGSRDRVSELLNNRRADFESASGQATHVISIPRCSLSGVGASTMSTSP